MTKTDVFTAATAAVTIIACAACVVAPAAGQNKSGDKVASTNDPLAELTTRLTPEGRKTLGVAPASLRPNGHELADKFLRPLAQGRGRLSAEEVATGIVRASEPGRRQVVERLMRDEVQLLGGIAPQPLGRPYNWYHAPCGIMASLWRAMPHPRGTMHVLSRRAAWL